MIPWITLNTIYIYKTVNVNTKNARGIMEARSLGKGEYKDKGSWVEHRPF